MIDFKDIEETVINNFYGGKGDIYCRMFKDENGKILVSRVPAKSSIGLHKHEYNSEIVYVISGEIKFILDGKEEIVKKGQCHYCPKGHSHEIINEKDEECCTFNVVL